MSPQRPASRLLLPTRALRVLLGVLLAGATVLAGGAFGAAGAIPPGGPGPATPGTSSAIGTAQVAVGGTLKFTVRGFPGGETLYIKIDDEKFCTAPPFGACVYHQQRIPANGVVNGSMTLPAGLAPGKHTLRFLASETVVENGQETVKGYTRGSPEFTVVAASGGSGGSGGSGSTGGSGSSGSSGDSGTTGSTGTTGTGGDTATDAAATDGADGTAGGGLVAGAPGGASPSPEAAPAASGGAAQQPVLVAVPTAAPADDDLVPMPWVGLYVLLGCLLVSSLMTTIAVFRRR